MDKGRLALGTEIEGEEPAAVRRRDPTPRVAGHDLHPRGAQRARDQTLVGEVVLADVVALVREMLDQKEALPVSRNSRTLYFSAGRDLWAFDAAYGRVRGPYATGGEIVGVGYGTNDRRLFAVRTDGRMLAFNAATGRRIA